MTPGGRAAAAIEILDRVGATTPAEQALTTWARGNRFAGSGDRAAIRDIVFDVLRRRRSSAVLGGGETGRALVLGLLRGQGDDPAALFTGEGYAPPPLSPEEAAHAGTLSEADALDLPDWLLPDLRASLGEALAPVAAILRDRAPVGLRVNTLRADHDAAARALEEDEIGSEPHPLAATARIVTRNPRRVKTSRAYRDGLVELQDPASQAVLEVLGPIPRDARILDFCAGGGGKSLALAAMVGGAIAAHDADPRRMRDLPARASRAGANIQCLDTPDVQRAAPWDLVLVDAPCSGSGAWRRQPEAKWTLTRDRLSALQRTQGEILAAAAALVAPSGRLAYVTCSLLDAENQAQVQSFLSSSADPWRLEAERRFLPTEGGDGFFVAHLKRD